MPRQEFVSGEVFRTGAAGSFGRDDTVGIVLPPTFARPLPKGQPQEGGSSPSGRSGRLASHPVGPHCRLGEVTPPPLAQRIALGLMHPTQGATPFHRINHDVPPSSTVVGTPARIVKLNGERTDQSLPWMAPSPGAEPVDLEV
jgi:hypothetical protein